ncbi:unnamed protein product [Adineta ricciae]|uniref:N-acetyltransferase domain-containing protein n=1 Tax=Adineta ricciae TaxID=249248 RepID=A0A816AUI1_ADIRI|nr:unnamed protein product [Adineta ricciae]
MLKQPIKIESNLVIRNAIETDCDDIMRLINELAVFEKAPEQVRINSQTLKQDGFGEHPLYTCLVVEDASSSPVRVVAIALMFNVYSTWEGKCLHLEDLYVQVDYRKRGIGKALFAATYQIAVETNCARLNFSVLDWNSNALDFYKSFGAVDITEKEGWHSVRVTRKNMELQLEKWKK